MKELHRATLPRAGAAFLLLVLLAGTLADHHGHQVEHHDQGPQVGHHSGPQVGHHSGPQVGHHSGPQVGHHGHDDDEDDDEHHEEEYEALEQRLHKVFSRVHRMDDDLDFRLGTKLRRKAFSLEHRIDKLEGRHCDKYSYDCQGRDNQCVSRLMVCDGIKDCRNGDDEKHCSLPTNTGDTFVGHVVFDHCTQRHPDTLSFTITAVKISPAFKGFPKLRARIDISKDAKLTSTRVSLPTVGYYAYASQDLVLLPPEDDGLALICDFDGHNPDKCVGNIMPQMSLETCAQFIFFRKHH